MQEDDLLPNDGSYFMAREPQEQVIERLQEQAQTLQGLDEIKKVIVHLDERIAYRDSIEALNVDLSQDPLLHQKKCEVNDMLKLALIEEKQLLEELVSLYGKNK